MILFSISNLNPTIVTMKTPKYLLNPDQMNAYRNGVEVYPRQNPK